MRHIASVSFGKDSLAMVLMLIEKKMPLDEVIFYDTGMEFQAIYDTRDKVVPLLKAQGIAYTELHPKNPFLYDMLTRPVRGRTTTGYGWCGGRYRWGTTNKAAVLDAYKKQYGGDVTEYVGIAADETDRIKSKVYPLVTWGMTEAACLQYCYGKGFSWEENGVKLYSVLDRVSCWCCRNKNRRELKNIYIHLPDYWEKLKDLQAKIDRPMKKFCNKKHGEYGNLFDMERVFEFEKEGGK